MVRPRIDPLATARSPVLGAVVTAETLDRVLEYAAKRGVNKSVVVRELLDYALARLDAARVRRLPPTPRAPRNGKTRPVVARIPLEQIPVMTRLANAAGLTPSDFVRQAVADAIEAAGLVRQW
jgi:hypothetical protein